MGEEIVRVIRHFGELDSLRVENLDTSYVVEIQDDGSEQTIVHGSATATATATVSVRDSVDGEESPPRA